MSSWQNKELYVWYKGGRLEAVSECSTSQWKKSRENSIFFFFFKACAGKPIGTVFPFEDHCEETTNDITNKIVNLVRQ